MKTVKLPGLIDPHVHLRDPGATYKEDIETGTKAAVAGGLSFVLDMPNNPEPTIRRSALDKKTRLVREKAMCGVGFIFGASQDDNSAEFPKVQNLVYGLKVYMDSTTGSLLIEDSAVLEKIFERWGSEKPIVVHAEGDTMNNAIDLAKKFHNKLHIAHVSQRSELRRIIEEKEKGVPITCEVTPHHLFLTDSDRDRLGHFGVMKPPLRPKRDVDFLWKHIGAIDCIATDHAPHTREEKLSDKPPYGVPGLETSLPLMLTAVRERRITIETVIRMMHTRPKEIFAIPVTDKPVLAIDLDKSYIIDNSNLKTKCGWSPFHGMRVWGRREE